MVFRKKIRHDAGNSLKGRTQDFPGTDVRWISTGFCLWFSHVFATLISLFFVYIFSWRDCSLTAVFLMGAVLWTHFLMRQGPHHEWRSFPWLKSLGHTTQHKIAQLHPCIDVLLRFSGCRHSGSSSCQTQTWCAPTWIFDLWSSMTWHWQNKPYLETEPTLHRWICFDLNSE